MNPIETIGSSRLITQDGFELLEANPEYRELFEYVIRSEFERPKGKSEFTAIGSGRHGRVSEIPGMEDLCVKMSSSSFTKQARILGDSKKGDPENLIIQTEFLDRVRRELLKTPEHEIAVPRQYVAARSYDNVFVSIQERVGSPFASLSSLRDEWQHQDTYSQLIWLVKERIEIALGSTVLRFGIDDLWQKKTMNTGNVLIDSTRSDDFIEIANSMLFVIDQPAHKFKTARALLRFSDL